jgi:hypothetical protein
VGAKVGWSSLDFGAQSSQSDDLFGPADGCVTAPPVSKTSQGTPPFWKARRRRSRCQCGPSALLARKYVTLKSDPPDQRSRRNPFRRPLRRRKARQPKTERQRWRAVHQSSGTNFNISNERRARWRSNSGGSILMECAFELIPTAVTLRMFVGLTTPQNLGITLHLC